jgi:hypothetical protein
MTLNATESAVSVEPIAPFAITVPGVYDMPAETYHADPVPGGSLSSTGARKLLPPSCPARFKYDRDNPPESTATFDAGKAAHKLVLGAGETIVRVDAPDWRSNAAKAERDTARAAGRIPMLDKEYGQAEDMAAAVLAHPLASILFDPDNGKPEQNLFSPVQVLADDIDPPQLVPVWRRARLDWLPDLGDGSGRYIVPEYKTCASADPERLTKAFAEFWYPQQADWNLSLVSDLGIAANPRMVFVCQEKTPPYLVTVVEPDVIAMRAGRIRNTEAIRSYARCVATGHWPGYSDDVEPLPLPAWIERDYLP